MAENLRRVYTKDIVEGWRKNPPDFIRGWVYDDQGRKDVEGHILSLAGMPDEELLGIYQQRADILTGRVLGISQMRVSLLRFANDHGSEQFDDICEALTDPEALFDYRIAPITTLILALGRAVEKYTPAQWEMVSLRTRSLVRHEEEASRVLTKAGDFVSEDVRDVLQLVASDTSIRTSLNYQSEYLIQHTFGFHPTLRANLAPYIAERAIREVLTAREDLLSYCIVGAQAAMEEAELGNNDILRLTYKTLNKMQVVGLNARRAVCEIITSQSHQDQDLQTVFLKGFIRPDNNKSLTIDYLQDIV